MPRLRVSRWVLMLVSVDLEGSFAPSASREGLTPDRVLGLFRAPLARCLELEPSLEVEGEGEGGDVRISIWSSMTVVSCARA